MHTVMQYTLTTKQESVLRVLNQNRSTDSLDQQLMKMLVEFSSKANRTCAERDPLVDQILKAMANDESITTADTVTTATRKAVRQTSLKLPSKNSKVTCTLRKKIKFLGKQTYKGPYFDWGGESSS